MTLAIFALWVGIVIFSAIHLTISGGKPLTLRGLIKAYATTAVVIVVIVLTAKLASLGIDAS